MPTDPISVRWTLHALDKAQKLGFARMDVESVLLAHHRERRRNAAERGDGSPLGGSWSRTSIRMATIRWLRAL